MSHTNHEKNFTANVAMEKIRSYLEELVHEFGINQNNFSHEDYSQLVKELKKTKRNLESVYRRGGVTIVTVDDTFITAYRFASFKITHTPKLCHSTY